jgi:PhoPQ-activated pathogenicity-related protein
MRVAFVFFVLNREAPMWSGRSIARWVDSLRTKPRRLLQESAPKRAKILGRVAVEFLEDRTLLSPAASTTLTALDAYVAAPDSSYHYSLNSTLTGTGYTDYVIDLTSQTWRSASEVDKPVWHHWLQIVVPTTATTTTAVLEVTGGSNTSGAPTSADGYGVLSATTLGAITTILPDVPSEPLLFAGETSPRTEDQIIAYTYNQYLNGGDANWPLLLPMVKSAVRAMDTTQAFVATLPGGTTHVDNFIVTGASKRGWTTWLTPAVDSRVRAIVPYVFDILNFSVNVPHLKDTYVGVTQDIVGGYPGAVQDYTNFHIFDRLLTPQGQALGQIVDPFQYIGRPTYLIPKYLVVSTGDQFFVPDSAQFYFHALPGQNYIRYVPNTDHRLNSDAVTGAINFEKALLDGAQLPRFSWDVVDSGTTIQVTTIDTPVTVKMWQATNPNNRDLRLETIGPGWTSSILTDQGGGHFVAHITPPATGATGFLVELTYMVDGVQLTFTTQVSTVPLFAPTVVAVAPGGTYNGNPFATTATATAIAGGPVPGSFALTYYVGSTVSGLGSSTPPTNAGTYTVVALFTSANPAYVNGLSLPVTFTVNNPLPAVTSLNTMSVPEGSASFTLSVVGSGFVPGSLVRWNGTSLATTLADANHLQATIPASNLVEEGVFAIDVFNSGPGGGFSSASSFTVVDASITATGVKVVAIEGSSFTAPVATFSDPNPGAAAGDFTASINWGDGQFSPGVVAASGTGGFIVTGTHTYPLEGRYTIQVTVNDVGGSHATSTSLAHIARTGPKPTGLPIAAAAITHSAEHYSLFVTAAYLLYLGRMPDTQGLSGWVTAMQNGLTDERLEADFIASAEYIQRNGGLGAGWIRAMYQNLLNRTPSDSEVNAWVTALNNGLMPTDIAFFFAASPEREAIRVRADYQTYLGRAATDAEVNAWVQAFANNQVTNEDVIAGFISSTEYFQTHYDNAGDWLFSAYNDVLGRIPDDASYAAWLAYLRSS